MRRFLVDIYHYHAHLTHLEAGKEDLPRDFLYELALAHSANTYKPVVYNFSEFDRASVVTTVMALRCATSMTRVEEMKWHGR